MDKTLIKEEVKKFNCGLKLERKIAGVKFLFDEQEFETADARKLTVKMPYCVMIRNAMKGKSIKAVAENSGCPGGSRALGMIEPDEYFKSGRRYLELGLYRDLATSKNAYRNATLCSHKLFGVMVKPLEGYNTDPDIVLIVTNPYNCMRIIQAYTYAFGVKTTIKMSGNQAICSECTAFPFESNDINVSLLCSGTRYSAKWNDEEMAVGLPFNKFQPVIRGLYATLDPVEPNGKKKEIEARCRGLDTETPAIHYNKNYYTRNNPVD